MVSQIAEQKWRMRRNCYPSRTFRNQLNAIRINSVLLRGERQAVCVTVPDRRHIRLLHDFLHALSCGLSGIRSAYHRSSQHPASHQAEDEMNSPTIQTTHQDTPNN